MRALLKTLFGDWGTVGAVTMILIAALLLRGSAVCWLLVPCLTLASAVWLSLRR